ncbi:alpha/beta fold hydrolase [Sphingobium boeckii]|uniref:Pimeloyl-ACP methyl ester carboxylesterase n=1 Tax=Sphingobium boeckii TaxID=1082345 RepID=A0A7W9AJA0_9SPHN|nr:alpha/beta hydrolase [Sphingobium boeckii]MBB5686680.1 pimeloyl-ACP methyl ester carboxylesterase [Sphingobium boeckii]
MQRWRMATAIAAMMLISPSSHAAPPESGTPYLSVAQLRGLYDDPAGHIAVIEGMEVYYKDEGKGPAILMVHGSRSSLRQWDDVAAKLTDRYRVIRYDIPAAGLSGTVTDAQAAAVQPTDIAEKLLAQLGVDHITFVGVSSGGTLGMYLAAKRPDLVDRLIMANTPADPVKTDHLKPTPSWAQALQRAADTKFEDQDYWKEYLTFFSGDGRRIGPAKIKAYYDLNRRNPEKHMIALVAKIGDGKAAKVAMAQVKAPTLLIWGGADPLLTPPAANALERYLTGTQVSKIFMPDVGHYPPLEAPERFAQIVAAYIEAATPAP